MVADPCGFYLCLLGVSESSPMTWWDQTAAMIGQLLTGGSLAGVLMVLGLVAASGMALGNIKIKGTSIGVVGVLITGVIYAHFLWSDAAMQQLAPAATSAISQTSAEVSALVARAQERVHMLEMFRDFGLILFVYSIGMQVGPGFFGSLRAAGLTWNLLAAGVVVLGFCVTWLVCSWGHMPPIAAVGVMSGAVTNTPGLAAAQQALKDISGLHPRDLALPGIGYAVAYPFGVLGIILSMIAVRFAFRINTADEARRFSESGHTRKIGLTNINLIVNKPAAVGRTVAEVTAAAAGTVVISRLAQGGVVRMAESAARLAEGDILHAVGSAASLDRLKELVGDESAVDLRTRAKNLAVRRLLVTRNEAVGRTLEELDLRQGYDLNITRIIRAGVEFVATPHVVLHYGDSLVAVGDAAHVTTAERLLGNSISHLEHPRLLPVFAGLVLGVLLGQIPIPVGLPEPVKLGLAGGPLVVALLLSWLGHVGRISFFVPHGAIRVIRELGLVLFISCVGLIAGGGFVDTLVTGEGLRWMAMGMIITVVPLLIMALIARLILRLNYMPLCGIMAGSMTDSPAMAFANTAAGNELPAIAYATVYPLTLILRILAAQLFVILFV